jgi:carbon storage regulator CsrA
MRIYMRGVDEGLVIGESVQINVLEVQADCVRLAIIDPEASPQYREEVLYLRSDDDCCQAEYESSAACEDEDSLLIPMR